MDENKIDDLIDEWHSGDSEKELYEYLGMSLTEYKAYIETGNLKEK